MATALRLKLILLFFSIILIAFVQLHKRNYGKDDDFIFYQEISWDDFKGYSKPFSKWAAVIKSDVYLLYDSANQEYSAIAKMNRSGSWKNRAEPSLKTLEHEQYHFNLTQYYATKLSLALKNNRNSREPNQLLFSTRQNLQRTQELYDSETDHGLKSDMQSYWQFKIDSLNLSLKENKYRTDLHAEIRFLDISKIEKEKYFDQKPVISYIIKINGYKSRLTSLTYDEVPDFDNFHEAINTLYEKRNLPILELSEVKRNALKAYKVRVLDEPNQTQILEYWLMNTSKLHIYQLKIDTNYPYKGYEKLFDSFSKTITLIDTDSIWKNLSQKQEFEVYESGKYDAEIHDGCAVMSEEKAEGFYQKALRNDNGDLLFPYTPVNYPDSLIDEVAVLYNFQWYYFANNDSTLIQIPKEDLVSGEEMYLGFFLNNDTINKCQSFIHEALAFDIEKRP